MYYGGFQTIKFERPLRKYYSADGTMEVKENRTTNKLEFITFIGGDGYSAPVAAKSDGTTSKYIYLHRDALSELKAVKAGSTTVLGHYPDYVNLAERMGARRFQIPTNVWNKMSPAEQWAANVKFLDRTIMRGDNIRLATPLSQVKPGSFFERELKYLFIDNNYKISSDGLWIVK
jgi:hypothetical protein